MQGTAHAAWLDAWEGDSTPCPDRYGPRSHRVTEGYYGRRDAQAQPQRDKDREWARRQGRSVSTMDYRDGRMSSVQDLRAQTTRRTAWREEWAEASEWTGSVVHMSDARRARRGSDEPCRVAGGTAWDYAADAYATGDRATGDCTYAEYTYQDSTDEGYGRVSLAQSRDDYDWEAAARRRPNRDECERVILHSDRTIEACLDSRRYYGREATARRQGPWPDAKRRASAPRLRLVKQRAPRRRLGLLAGVFAVLLVSLTVVLPIMTSSAVAGLESAVGQAEAQQEQLAADTAALASQISSLSSPRRVAEEAVQLGLVPANTVSYLATGEQILASEGDTTVAGR